MNRELHHPTTNSTNFILVQDEDTGDIIFGCPPEVVKYFNSKKRPIPSNIVIPQRTFRRGKNYFDLEFVAYSIIFSKRSSRRINIVCSESQQERIRIVLQEALFGPVFKNVFQPFLFELLSEYDFDDFGEQQTTSLKGFTETIAANADIFLQFKKIVAQKLDRFEIVSKMQPLLRSQIIKEMQWVATFPEDISRLITEAYVKAGLLKNEMNVFSICPENEQDKFINNFIHFHHFDKEGEVMLEGENGGKLLVRQTNTGTFKLYKKNKLVDSFNMQLSDEEREVKNVAEHPFELPEFGITFLGTGNGFDPDTCTSCYIIWINGKGIVVDLLANCEEHFRRLGIASSDITHIFLSHLHADHDAGVLEKIMLGKKTHFLTSNLIFESFLRKAEALTRFSYETVKEFVDFTNVDKGVEVDIPEIEDAYITFDYSFHSIPTGRFKLRYKTRNGEEVKIGFSGDTKYDEKLINSMYDDGLITAERRDGILGFLWDCDLIIHEAGGGVLHTEVDDLKNLPSEIKKKVILTHADQNTRKSKEFRFAREGETLVIVKDNEPLSMDKYTNLLKDTGLFPEFKFNQFQSLLQKSAVETFSKGEYVIKEGNPGYKLYIILAGFVEVIKGGKVISLYEKGSFFGELALIDKEKKRCASVRAKSEIKLLCVERADYTKYKLSTLMSEKLYGLVNYFADLPHSSLIGFLSRGELTIFGKGENIITFGDSSRDVYILLTGTVDFCDSKGEQVAKLDQVEVLGAYSYLNRIPRTASVKVSSNQASAIRLDEVLFEKIYKRFPFFHATVLKKIDQRHWKPNIMC